MSPTLADLSKKLQLAPANVNRNFLSCGEITTSRDLSHVFLRASNG